MTNEILNQVKEAFQKAIHHLKEEYTTLQAGQANPAMIENIMVNAYGQNMRIKELASTTVPEPQQLLISPWDKGLLSAIEKAIRDSDLGFNPLNDWWALRINIPKLTEERRRDLVKVVHTKAEESKISIRQSRHDGKSKLEKLEISEDALRDAENELQDETNKANKEVEELCKKKEEMIMKV